MTDDIFNNSLHIKNLQVQLWKYSEYRSEFDEIMGKTIVALSNRQ